MDNSEQSRLLTQCSLTFVFSLSAFITLFWLLGTKFTHKKIMLINNNREWWWTWQWWDIYYKNTHYSRKGAHWCGSIDPTSCMWDLESDRKDPFVLFRDSVRSDVHHFPYLSSIPPQPIFLSACLKY